MTRTLNLLLPLPLLLVLCLALPASLAAGPPTLSHALVAILMDDGDEPGEEDESEDEESSQEAGSKDDDSEEEPKEKKKDRKTTEVEQKPIKIDVTVDGVFVARTMTPVALRPEVWSSFKIEEVVPHGSKVREGQVLVKFEAKKLNDEISDLELSQRIAELSIRKAEKELPRLEKSLEMSLTDAEQSHQRTHDDYKRYTEVDRDRLIESLKMSLKMSKQRLDYARDELEQLKKMYEADDLTEETEELILTRTQQQFEISEYYHEQAKIRYEETMRIYLPRQDVENRELLDRVDLSLERAKLASQIDLNRARYELEQQKIRRDKSLEKHAKLVQDRALMQIKSPADGVVYYGKCVNGKWSDMGSMITKLQPHGSVSSGTVMMTIVEPKPMYLLATVAEKHRPAIELGLPAKIKPAADDTESLAGSVASVSTIPVASGKFALEVDLTDDDTPSWLVPGMSGKIKLTTYHNKKALVLDKKAIKSEEDDEDKKYVWLVEEDDDEQTVKKQAVKLGKTKGDLVEVVEGLEAGDVVSLEDEEEEGDD